MTDLFQMLNGFIPALVVGIFFMALNIYDWLNR